MRTSICALLLVGVVACGSSDETPGDANMDTGSLSLEIWGESYAETGLPSSVFDDGYAVVFDKFLVSLSSATVADADSNGDGEVTQAELGAVTEGYDGGSYFTADNFWDYLNKESTFLGHVDGENECI